MSSPADVTISHTTVEHCNCKSSCCTKRKENSSRGCPCKGRNEMCSLNCRCGTRSKPCKNKETGEQCLLNTLAPRPTCRGKQKKPGFRLTHKQVESEEVIREKEDKDVKAFIATLDEAMVRKLAVRSLRRGIGSMDYIHSLLIMEDYLDSEEEDGTGEFGEQLGDLSNTTVNERAQAAEPEPDEPMEGTVPDWCVCHRCRPMPQEVENKCCRQKKCITYSSRFAKLCMDPDVLELCIRNTSDIRNDQEDNSTRAFRKAAYRQFILARYGYLGKGNRRVCPSCVVLKIRSRYPSLTGVYMGYREQ